MKILYSPASPYSAKARMAAQFTGLPFESEIVDTNTPPDILVGNNPLGKIPVLLTDAGDAVFDSRSITRYLDRESGGKLFPVDPAARTRAEVLEALADGITDSLVAHVYERRFRPEEKVHQPWLDRHWAKVARGLDHLQANPPSLAEGLNAGHLALAATAGYLALRFAGQWEERWPWVSAYLASFESAFPAFPDYRPQ